MSSKQTSSPPPVLHFDDGTRIMTENAGDCDCDTDESTTPVKSKNPRTAVSSSEIIPTSIPFYYEIDRISSEIIQTIVLQNKRRKRTSDDGFLCKVALQFPDEQLEDAPEVTWLMEEAIQIAYDKVINLNDNQEEGKETSLLASSQQLVPLVYVLGDTTYGSCCTDEIGALHLDADVIVHYGRRACLSPTEVLPVIHSFGNDDASRETWLSDCVENVHNQIRKTVNPTTEQDDTENLTDIKNQKFSEKILVVHELRYHHAIEDLRKQILSSSTPEYEVEVVIGSVPENDFGSNLDRVNPIPLSSSCCGHDNGGVDKKKCGGENEGGEDKGNACNSGRPCCADEGSMPAQLDSQINMTTSDSNKKIVQLETEEDNCTIGGLHFSIHPKNLSQYKLLYIGDDAASSGNSSRQFLNTILYCTSPSTGTKACWSYNPSSLSFTTDPSSNLALSRYLNRRFYLTQKAKLANIIGILVGTLSQSRFKSVVTSLRSKIELSGRACYTFVVGKMNIAKLANFGEIECFVLVSCTETSVLVDERDFHVPIVTPRELEVALGEKEWAGNDSCNTNFDDFLKGFTEKENKDEKSVKEEGDVLESTKDEDNDESDADEKDDEDDEDEPYFSVITGTYVSRPKAHQQSKDLTNNHDDLTSKPGGGQMTEYKSEAAEYWKRREYKGLEAQIGKDEAKAASLGQTGIASDYGNR